jgi:hypothetical protein
MTELDWTLTQMTFLLTNQNAAPVISCQQVWLQVVNEKQEKECQKDIIQNITIKPFISQEFMMLAFKLVRDFFIKLFRDWGCHSLISEFEIQHFYFKGNSGWEPPPLFFFQDRIQSLSGWKVKSETTHVSSYLAIQFEVGYQPVYVQLFIRRYIFDSIFWQTPSRIKNRTINILLLGMYYRIPFWTPL